MINSSPKSLVEDVGGPPAPLPEGERGDESVTNHLVLLNRPLAK